VKKIGIFMMFILNFWTMKTSTMLEFDTIQTINSYTSKNASQFVPENFKCIVVWRNSQEWFAFWDKLTQYGIKQQARQIAPAIRWVISPGLTLVWLSYASEGKPSYQEGRIRK
jgi:hypothetical protein